MSASRFSATIRCASNGASGPPAARRAKRNSITFWASAPRRAASSASENQGANMMSPCIKRNRAPAFRRRPLASCTARAFFAGEKGPLTQGKQPKSREETPKEGSNTLPPIIFPGRPERWWGDEALKAETDAPQATLEQRHQAAGDVLALRCRGFFSAGGLFLRASHIPVETAP